MQHDHIQKLFLPFIQTDRLRVCVRREYVPSQCKKIAYNINVLQQTACLVINPFTIGNLLSSLIARRWVGLQTL